MFDTLIVETTAIHEQALCELHNPITAQEVRDLDIEYLSRKEEEKLSWRQRARLIPNCKGIEFAESTKIVPIQQGEFFKIKNIKICGLHKSLIDSSYVNLPLNKFLIIPSHIFE